MCVCVCACVCVCVCVSVHVRVCACTCIHVPDSHCEDSSQGGLAEHWLGADQPTGQQYLRQHRHMAVTECLSTHRHTAVTECLSTHRHIIIIIIIDNFCIALFSGVPKLTALYNILQHFLSFTNIIDIIMTTNNV